MIEKEISKPSWVPSVEKRMDELGLTQEHLCPYLNVTTRGAVGHYFNGRRKLSIDQAESLCELLALPSSIFIKDDNTDKEKKPTHDGPRQISKKQMETALENMHAKERKKLISKYIS